MDADTQRLIERLHASPTMAVVAVAGAGAQAITWLLDVPGASRTVLEILVPYSSASFVEFLGYEPEQVVAERTAADMARSAYQRAVRLREGGAPVVGVGCTAAITTDRPRRGEHRCHVAAWSRDGVTTSSLTLVKGLRDRESEDTIVSKLVLRALAEASGVDAPLSLDLDEKEPLESRSVRYEDPIKSLVAGHVGSVTVHPDGRMVVDEGVHGGVLPGYFNPLHKGHEGLSTVASEMLEVEVTFELSIANVDKPDLEEPEVRRRLAQFAGKWPVVVTRAPVFYQKARLFPGCTFVIGRDTAARLVEPRYYGGEDSRMVTALEEVRRLGCRFLVAGRVAGGEFHTLADIPIPRGFDDLFTPIPESRFRCDLSSTELRQAGGKT